MNTRREKPLVSVIISCYNYAHFIPEALESILNQTYENWECIVVDDGSVDDTKKIVQSYVRKDRRFKYIYQSNQGVSVARNTGIKNCRGEYVQLLDADDLIAQEKLESQLKCFKTNPSADIVYSEYQCFDNENRSKTWTYSRVYLEEDVLKDFAQHWEKKLSIPIHCFLYKKTCFDKWGLFDESFLFGKEDWDLHLRFANAGAEYMFLEGVTALYRVTNCSMVRNSCKMRRGKNMLLRKHILNSSIPFSVKCILLQRYLADFCCGLYLSKVNNVIKKIFTKMKSGNFVFYVLGGVIFLRVFYFVLDSPLSFDSSYNLQFSQSLYATGRYSTTVNNEIHLFDPKITTGPTVLIPIALLFYLFGDSVMVANSVIMFYFLGSILLSFLIMKELSTKLLAIVGCFILLNTKDFFLLQSHWIVGEIATTFYILLSYYFFISKLKNRHFFIGLFLALAILSKFIALLALIAFIFTVVIHHFFLRNGPMEWRTVVQYILGLILPFGVFEIFRLVQFGNIGEYVNNIFAQASFISGYDKTIIPPSYLATLDTLVSSTHFGVSSLFVMFLAFVFYKWIDFFKERKDSLFMFLFIIMNMSWFVFMSRGWFRHIWPGYFIFILFSYMVFVSVIKGVGFKKKLILLGIFGYLLSAPGIPFFNLKMGPNVALLQDQIEFSKQVQQKLADQGGTIFFDGWWQVPEISFLTKKQFYDLYKYTPEIDKDFVILSPAQKSDDLESLERINAICEKSSDNLVKGDYKLCLYKK